MNTIIDNIATESNPPTNHSAPPTSGDPEVSRRSKPTRDMLNLMLDDGLPYHVIIDELAETGRGLTPQGLTKWVQAGYQEYLKERETIEGVKTQAEFAADLLREL